MKKDVRPTEDKSNTSSALFENVACAHEIANVVLKKLVFVAEAVVVILDFANSV